MFVSPAYAQAAAGSNGAAAIAQFVPLIAIFLIMYFLMIRPQQKKMKAHQAMVGALKRGDSVVTQGGILARVSKVHDQELELEIADGVKVRVVRSSIASVVNRTDAAANAPARPV